MSELLLCSEMRLFWLYFLPSSMEELQQRLDSGALVFLDGAVGTELQQMGVPMDDVAWCATALKTHPDTIRQLHEDYINAGADIITANTYASSPHNLAAVGLGDQAKELNTRAVELARQAVDNTAVDRPVWIAGSLSSFGVYNVSRGSRDVVPMDVIEASYRMQAAMLAEAKVDLLVLEMVREEEQGGMLLKAALETGLPVWVGLSCSLAADGSVKMLSADNVTGASKLDFAEILNSLMSIGGSTLAVMHSDVKHITPALKIALEEWTGPMAAYANSGNYYRISRPSFEDAISPEDYLAYAKEWVELGVQIIGGCCGIGRDHIRVLSHSLPSNAPA